MIGIQSQNNEYHSVVSLPTFGRCQSLGCVVLLLVSLIAWGMSALTHYSLMPEYPTDVDDTSPRPRNVPRGFLERTKATGRLVFHHIVKHTGVGIVCSVAYFDP
jgi:hypothetical protein